MNQYQQPGTKSTLAIPALGHSIFASSQTGLVYVSSSAGIHVYDNNKLIHTIPSGGHVMAFSPSEKYIVTNGGVYESRLPFSRVFELPQTMSSASFAATDKEFVIVSAGSLIGYDWIAQNYWAQQYNLAVNEKARLIARGDNSWAILTENGRLSIISDNIGWDEEEPVKILDSVFPREEWTGNVRLISDGGVVLIASDRWICAKKYADLHAAEDIYYHDSFETGSAFHDMIVYRDAFRLSGNIYRISRCGNFLLRIMTRNLVAAPVVEEEPKPKPKPARQERVDPGFGVMTRSQYKAYIALHKVIKV